MKSSNIMPLFFCILSVSAFGQPEGQDTTYLSLSEVIDAGAIKNISINAQKLEEAAVESDLKDARNSIFPNISASAGYQRYSKIGVYDGFLGQSHTITKPPNPNAGSLGVESFFNLYSGKKQQNAIKISELKSDLTSINTTEHTADIKLQVAQQYLDMVRLFRLKGLTGQQIVRAQKRLANIRSMYKNGVVTRSDVLRAELMLSQVLLNDEAANNDFRISNNKLNVLLNLPKSQVIIPKDTASIDDVNALTIENILDGSSTPYAIRKSETMIDISSIQPKILKADQLPSVGIVGAYGFNYPNTIVSPPLDQTLRFGFLGVKISYNLSSLYHSKFKINAANQRLEERKIEKEYLEKNIDQQKQALHIKYLEALNRLKVAKKSIEQAAANYDIIDKKYANQLALLTDLLDADDLYLQSQYNYVQAQVMAQGIYYQMMYITGQL